MNEITDKKKYEEVIAALTPEQIKMREEAILEGFSDEQCPKCGVILLSFHHFLTCHLAKCGDCPMSSGSSVLDMLLNDDKKG